jgi:hypothetical protein
MSFLFRNLSADSLKSVFLSSNFRKHKPATIEGYGKNFELKPKVQPVIAQGEYLNRRYTWQTLRKRPNARLWRDGKDWETDIFKVIACTCSWHRESQEVFTSLWIIVSNESRKISTGSSCTTKATTAIPCARHANYARPSVFDLIQAAEYFVSF